jgi:hypothetical protein
LFAELYTFQLFLFTLALVFFSLDVCGRTTIPCARIYLLDDLFVCRHELREFGMVGALHLGHLVAVLEELEGGHALDPAGG